MNVTPVREETVRDYLVVEDMLGLLDEIKPDSIISRTFYKGNGMKAILFGFDAGQELSEHTSSQTAVIQILQGDATITLGAETYELSAGSWVHMPPRLKHSVLAKNKMVMLLSMFDIVAG